MWSCRYWNPFIVHGVLLGIPVNITVTVAAVTMRLVGNMNVSPARVKVTGRFNYRINSMVMIPVFITRMMIAVVRSVRWFRHLIRIRVIIEIFSWTIKIFIIIIVVTVTWICGFILPCFMFQNVIGFRATTMLRFMMWSWDFCWGRKKSKQYRFTNFMEMRGLCAYHINGCYYLLPRGSFSLYNDTIRHLPSGNSLQLLSFLFRIVISQSQSHRICSMPLSFHLGREVFLIRGVFGDLFWCFWMDGMEVFILWANICISNW